MDTVISSVEKKRYCVLNLDSWDEICNGCLTDMAHNAYTRKNIYKGIFDKAN